MFLVHGMFSSNYNQWGLRCKPAWKREWKELAVLERLGHGLAEGLRQHKGGQAGHQGRHAEEAGRVAAQQQQVRGQDGSQPAHHYAEAHAHATHHRWKLFGREQVEDGVGAVACEPTNDGDGNSELKDKVRVANKGGRFLFFYFFTYFFLVLFLFPFFFNLFRHLRGWGALGANPYICFVSLAKILTSTLPELGILWRDEGMGEQGGPRQDEEHAHWVLATEGGALQGADHVDVARQLHSSRHQESNVLVLR